MKRNKATFLVIIILLLVGAGIAAGFYLFKPNRTVADETGIAITSQQLVKEYQANEGEANAKYLDKALEVTGVVSQVEKNQEGKVTLMLSSEDPMTSVFCTLKDDVQLKTGGTITVKGFCSGMLSDVRIREAVIINK